MDIYHNGERTVSGSIHNGNVPFKGPDDHMYVNKPIAAKAAYAKKAPKHNDIRMEVMRVRDSTRRCNSMQWKQELRDFKCRPISKPTILSFLLRKCKF